MYYMKEKGCQREKQWQGEEGVGKYRACMTQKMLAKAQTGWNTETDRNKSL